jgi:hypothetical protein
MKEKKVCTNMDHNYLPPRVEPESLSNARTYRSSHRSRGLQLDKKMEIVVLV